MVDLVMNASVLVIILGATLTFAGFGRKPDRFGLMAVICASLIYVVAPHVLPHPTQAPNLYAARVAPLQR